MKRLDAQGGMVFIIFCFLALRAGYAQDELYQQCSLEWHTHNDHLIPDANEAKGILILNQEYSKPWRSNSDADGDGIPNERDPSPYDWRENGYDPFGVLEFLS